MEQTLRALSEILQKASVTIVLLIVLYWYLKAMLYGPLEKMLKQRGELTDGTRKAAADSLAAADRKTSDYEAKLRDARTELYKGQEELRRQWLDEQASHMAGARERSSEQVQRAKQQITAEAAAARQSLEASVGVLADQIASAVLAPGGRV
jgi:F-type H+-transporting ATPase subunit b